MRSLPTLLATALLLVLLSGPPAVAASWPAGTYEHVSLPPGTDGWSPYVYTPGGFVSVSDSVSAGRGLRVGFWYRNPFAPGDSGEWSYAAPPGTEITGWRAEREVTGIQSGDWQAVIWVASGDRVQPFVPLVPAVNRAWSTVALGGLHADRIIARLVCGGPNACWHAGDSAQLGIRNAVALLRDDTAPRVEEPHGDLADERTLRGVVRLSAAATDVGGGLLRAAVLVDGAEASSTAVDGGAACHDLDPGPGRRFAARVPCPLGATAEAALDTRILRDGPHEIRVVVEDAAGNRTTVLGPSTRIVQNHPAPPATAPAAPPRPDRPAPVPSVPVASPGALRLRAWIPAHGRRAGSITLPHGAGVRVRGTVSDAAGRPAGGELLTVLARVGRGRWRPAGLVRAGADGRFSAWVGDGPSRSVAVTAGDARSAALSVRVRAGVTLRASRHGGWVAVRGRLLGGWIPRRGVLVGVQVLRRHRWVTLTTVRTTAAGRFRGRVPAASAERVRAAVERQPGYAFAAGVSPSRALRTAPRTSR
jgi:hypothetical protein